MKLKSKILLGSGIFLLIIGVVFSLSPYNPGSFPTVHHFTYGCNLQTPAFAEVYGGGFNSPEFCQHNTALSIVIIMILGTGVFLCYKVLRTKKENNSV